MTSIITELLGGAERGRVRARGFADWSPRAGTLGLLARVKYGPAAKGR